MSTSVDLYICIMKSCNFCACWKMQQMRLQSSICRCRLGKMRACGKESRLYLDLHAREFERRSNTRKHQKFMQRHPKLEQSTYCTTYAVLKHSRNSRDRYTRSTSGLLNLFLRYTIPYCIFALYRANSCSPHAVSTDSAMNGNLDAEGKFS